MDKARLARGSNPQLVMPGVSDPDYKYADPCFVTYVMLVNS